MLINIAKKLLNTNPAYSLVTVWYLIYFVILFNTNVKNIFEKAITSAIPIYKPVYTAKPSKKFSQNDNKFSSSAISSILDSQKHAVTVVLAALTASS